MNSLAFFRKFFLGIFLALAAAFVPFQVGYAASLSSWNDITNYSLRLGAVAHDVGLFSERRQDGVNINLELLGPVFYERFGTLRPHIGGSIATEDDNLNVGYFGITWDVTIVNDFFFTASLGGAVHDADNLTRADVSPTEIQEGALLGCRVLFRESLGFGYHINEKWNIHLHADHISNAGLCDNNGGFETAGVRFGYAF